MTARYWVLASDELMASDPRWPACLRPVERGHREDHEMCWWLFEDDDAPASLDGKRVELMFGVSNDVSYVAGRRPAP